MLEKTIVKEIMSIAKAHQLTAEILLDFSLNLTKKGPRRKPEQERMRSRKKRKKKRNSQKKIRRIHILGKRIGPGVLESPNSLVRQIRMVYSDKSQPDENFT